MERNSKTPTTIRELCKRLHCSELVGDLERVNHARQLMAQLQQNEILRNYHSNSKNKNIKVYHPAALKVSDMLLETKQRLNTELLDSSSSGGVEGSESVHTLDDSNYPQEEYEEEEIFECEELSNDGWLGFFRGYEILRDAQACSLGENKQCMALSLKDDGVSLQNYLRRGIRCFMIDLFLGTEVEKQKLIFHLRESELRISKEYGFLFNTTLFALLSPRWQYTGVMAAENSVEKLQKGNNVVITTKRKHSINCSSAKIYVNARFLLEDCKIGDFILIGPSIQLAVADVLRDELKCVVVESGLLSSRLPVRFPNRCRRSEVSLEELEDITFAHEVGITVLVSHMAGSRQYFEELCDTLDLLKFDNLRLFARLDLNEYEDECNVDKEWIAKCYDGFLLEIGLQRYNNCCRTEDDGAFEGPKMLELAPTCTNLMVNLFSQQKPIILNPVLIAKRQLCVPPSHVPHIFQFPDKYLFSKENCKDAFYFFLLQTAFTESSLNIELPIQIPCESSEAGGDMLARGCVSATFRSQIKAIIVCSTWPDTAIKVSHFRPQVPVILVSPTKSFVDHISLYHHLIFMHFHARSEWPYVEYVINAFIFSLIYLKSTQILRDGEKVLLVYATNAATQFCDNHLIFKFNEKHFALNLEDILFT